jgi:hypothetical protein
MAQLLFGHRSNTERVVKVEVADYAEQNAENRPFYGSIVFFHGLFSFNFSAILVAIKSACVAIISLR